MANPNKFPYRTKLTLHVLIACTQSGGSTAKSIYKCFGKNIRVLSLPSSIYEAEKNSLVASGEVDMIFSSYPDLATQHLFDPFHKGRAMVMLRHPVDRLVSKFYYLQIA